MKNICQIQDILCHCRSDRSVGAEEEGRRIARCGSADRSGLVRGRFCLLRILVWDRARKDRAEQREVVVAVGEMPRCKCWEDWDPVGAGASLPTAFLPVLVAPCSAFLLSCWEDEEAGPPSGPSPSAQNLLPLKPVPDGASPCSQQPGRVPASPGLMMGL